MKATIFLLCWLATAWTLRAGLVIPPLPVEPDSSELTAATPFHQQSGKNGSARGSWGQRILPWTRASPKRPEGPVGIFAPSPYLSPQKSGSHAGTSDPTGKTDVCAVLSFVFGILTLTNPYSALPFGIAAIVLGFVALKRIRDRGTRGQGWAVAGIIMGFLFLLFWLVMVLLLLLLVGFYLFHIFLFF